MERLVYWSKASEGTGTGDVFDIVDASARNNPARDITGFLIFDEDRFFQLIEGPGDALTALMERLGSDPRHHSVEILERRDAVERWFPTWKMKQLISFNSPPAMEELREILHAKEGGDRVLTLLNGFLNL